MGGGLRSPALQRMARPVSPELQHSGGAAAHRRGRLRLPPSAAASLPPDVAFLARHGVTVERLRLVSRIAEGAGTHASHELMAAGFERRRYWSSLADDLGLAFLDDLCGATMVADANMLATDAVRHAACVMVPWHRHRACAGAAA